MQVGTLARIQNLKQGEQKARLNKKYAIWKNVMKEESKWENYPIEGKLCDVGRNNRLVT